MGTSSSKAPAGPMEKKPTEASPLVSSNAEPVHSRIWDTLSSNMKMLLVGLVLLSLLLNIVALLPFVEEFNVDAQPSMVAEELPLGPYNFAKVLHLLHDHNLESLLVIVVIWTCVFPPFKLAMMMWTLLTPLSRRCRETSYGWLGHSARLSLMEIYLVQLIVMIFANQDHVVFVGIELILHIEVRYGITMFEVAIWISMIAGEILEQMEYSRAEAERTAAIKLQSKLQSLDEIPPQSFAVVRHAPTWAVSALVFTVARIALALAAFFTPLFTVNRLAVLPADLEQTVSQLNLTILLPNTWSIASGVGQMAQAGSPYQHLFAFDMCVFLVVTPLASGLLALWCILKPFGDLPIFEMRLMHALSRFGNLEVFLMAFVLYLSEQNYMIVIDTHEAYICLIFYLLCLIGSLVCTTRAVRTARDAVS